MKQEINVFEYAGRILEGVAGGKGSRNLAMRIVGDTYQAAYDARVVHQLFDTGADYFAAWGYLSGPHTWYQGLPSVSFHVAKEAAKFKGMRRLAVAAKGGARKDLELEAVAALDKSGRKMQIMAYSFTNSLHAAGTVKMRFDVKFPETWRGKNVTVTRRLVDDNSNWFDEWRKDRKALGLTDDRFNWSPDDPSVETGVGLADAKDRAHFRDVLAPRYRELARLKSKSRTVVVEDGKNLVFDSTVQVNSAMFIEFKIESK